MEMFWLSYAHFALQLKKSLKDIISKFIQIYLFSLDLLQFLVKHFVFVFNDKSVMNNINYPCRHHLL